MRATYGEGKSWLTNVFASAVSNDLIKLSNGLVDIEKVNPAYNTPYISALEYVVQDKQTRRPVFVVTFDPRLPDIQKTNQGDQC